MINNVGVHARHCCAEHGCKYGDEDCPVVNGTVEQTESCDECTENWQLFNEDELSMLMDFYGLEWTKTKDGKNIVTQKLQEVK